MFVCTFQWVVCGGIISGIICIFLFIIGGNETKAEQGRTMQRSESK